MINLARCALLTALLLEIFAAPLTASEINIIPALKATGLLAKPESNSYFYNPENTVYSSNEIGIRLNGEIKHNETTGFFLHVKNNILLSNDKITPAYKQSVFRLRNLSYSWNRDDNGQLQYDLYQEVDRMAFYTSIDKFTLTAGRQAISWGLGRFWQPLDIFGTFSPLSLDREYKPGIDALNLEWFPSDFSHLNLAYVFSNSNLTSQNDSAALHYVQQISERFYLSLLGASLLENAVLGLGVETQIADAGVRAEAVFYRWDDQWNSIAMVGLDYQFENEIVFTLEQLTQTGGANSQLQLSELQTNTLVNLGLQKHLSKSVTGIGLQKNLFPLLDVSYTLLVSTLNKPDWSFSSLHQFNMIYSTSNESDLTLSIMAGLGDKMQQGSIHSEFGSVPPSLTAQFRYYF